MASGTGLVGGSELLSGLPGGGSASREGRGLCRVLATGQAGGARAQGPPMPEGTVAGGAWGPGSGLASEPCPGPKASRAPAVPRLGDGSAAGCAGFHDCELAECPRRPARVGANATTCRLQFRVTLWERNQETHLTLPRARRALRTLQLFHEVIGTLARFPADTRPRRGRSGHAAHRFEFVQVWKAPPGGPHS